MSSSNGIEVETSNPVGGIMCDNCDSFAMAQLDNKVLCVRCLADIVKAGHRKNIDSIVPLNLHSTYREK